MLHKITQSTPWRGGAQIMEDVFEDAQLLNRVEVKTPDREEHWQVDTPEAVINNKP